MSAANVRFEIVSADRERVVIRDYGPWDKYMIVTNAAEDVVEMLFDRGILHPGQRLFYYDWDGSYDEIDIRDGKFHRFAVGQRRELSGDRLGLDAGAI